MSVLHHSGFKDVFSSRSILQCSPLFLDTGCVHLGSSEKRRGSADFLALRWRVHQWFSPGHHGEARALLRLEPRLRG